jgi:RHS repeat-associated protein
MKRTTSSARYRYDAWGHVLEKSGIFAEINPYRYAGYRYDNETGLYYLIARYYDPQHGHFISKDPDPGELDDLLSQNGYTYAHNNPMTSIDPDGNARFRFGGGMRFGGGPRISNLRVGRAFRAGTRVRLSALPAGAKVRSSRSKGSTPKKGFAAVVPKIPVAPYSKARAQSIAENRARTQYLRQKIYNSYGKYWSKGNRESWFKNMSTHFRKHGRITTKGPYMNPRLYTMQALKLYNENKHLPASLNSSGVERLHVKGTPGGYFTKNGQIISYWFKKRR